MLSTYAFDKYFDRLLEGYEPSRLNYSVSECYQSEDDSKVTIEMMAAGISRADLKVEVVDNLLTVAATPTTKTKLVNSFKKSWELGEHIDPSNITAKLENGVLTLTLPKIKPVKKSVKIEVT